MKKVAKLLIIDAHDQYLLLHRDNHPDFGNDPDLPGGNLDGDETILEAMQREVYEEAGIHIAGDSINRIYAGAAYSDDGTYYVLFTTKLEERPEVVISPEHASYEWLPRYEFLQKIQNTNDTYMHMVYDVLKEQDVNQPVTSQPNY